MKNNNYYSSILVYITVAFFLFFLPVTSYSSQLFHTIQVSSFYAVDDAQKQFDAIVETFNEEELDNLRIEKIGKFYCIRVGKFNNYTVAEESHRNIKSKLPQAAIMKAYVKDERIIRLYASPSGADVEEVKEKSLSIPVPEKIIPAITKKIESKEKPLPVPEQIVPAITKKTESKEKPLTLQEKIFAISSLVEKNEFNSALDIIKEAIAAQPEHADLNAWHGMVLLKLNRPLEAVKYLKKAVELSSDISDYHNALAYSLFYLKRFDGAVDEFNKAIHLEPVHVDALTGLCIIYAARGEKEKATEIYHKIKDVDKETSDKLLKLIEI